MSDQDGGTAFPIIHPDGSGVQYFGMPLRDYFAAKAMQGIFANESQLLRYGKVGADQGITTMRVVSEASYMQADAMLAERAK